MNRALTFTLLALAVVVVLFVATWFTIPSGRHDVRAESVNYPAKLLRYGIEKDEKGCVQRGPGLLGPNVCKRVAVTYQSVDPEAMKSRAAVFYGGLAAVIILVGAALRESRRWA